ncbi:MAG: hypothetical protein LBH21_00470 [Gracilibacteraceae bacterium]|jgi:hypothetical protein|nr:hypothetical protein [Gracilibacteraceae bacterium]
MKKVLLLAVIIIVALFGFALFNPWAGPSLAGAEPRLATDGSLFYFAENKSWGAFVFGADEQGAISFVYRDKAADENGRLYAVSDLVWSDGQLWLLRETDAAADMDAAAGAGADDAGAREGSSRQIWRLDPAGTATATVLRLPFRGVDFRLSAAGEQVYLTYRDADGRRAYAYGIEAGGAVGPLVLAADAPADTLIQAAVYSGKYLYCALSDGSVWAFSPAGAKTEFSGGEPAALWAGGDGFFFADQAAGAAHFALNALPAQAAPPENGATIRAGLPLADGFAALAAEPDGTGALRRYAGAAFAPPVPLIFSPAANLQFSCAAAVSPAGIGILALACFCFAAGGCALAASLFWRLLLLPFCLCLPLVFGVAALVAWDAGVNGGEPAAVFYRLLALCGPPALGLLLICLLLTVRWLLPLRRLPRQMSELAVRPVWDPASRIAFGEVGRVQRSMQELCLSLSIREYEMNAAMNSYRRFMPQDLDRLLHRANLMEIEYGDVAAGEGTVGLVTTMPSGASRRFGESHRRFLEFVFAAFRRIYTAASGSAVFLSTWFSLTDFRLLFPAGGMDGVRMGVRLATETAGLPAEDPRPEFMLVLHRAGYEYGVSGQENRAISFMSSYELGLLAKLSAKLATLGVKLLVTEQCEKTLAGAVSTRYIGYVASSDEQHNVKLYEVLDVYSESEKNLREQYNRKFQQAIRLYYTNDFYLARGLFSEIFKNCPGDGVAKWYIFSCERLFNRTDFSTVNYSLFGTEQ